MSKKLADDLGARPGDALVLNLAARSIVIPVIAIVNDIQTNTLYTSDQEVMSAFGTDRCLGLFVVLDSPNQADSYASFARGVPTTGDVVLKADLAASFNSLIAGAMDMFYAFFVLNLIIAFLVATSAALITASDKEMEFATIASLGLPKSVIRRSLMVEIGLLAVISALVAVPLSYVLAMVFASLLESAVFYIPIGFSLVTAVVIFLVGGLFVWLSIVWPLRRNGKLDLVRTLRDRLQ